VSGSSTALIACLLAYLAFLLWLSRVGTGPLRRELHLSDLRIRELEKRLEDYQRAEADRVRSELQRSRERRTERARDQKIGRAMLHVLHALRAAGEASESWIARKYGIDAADVASAMERLKGLEFVERVGWNAEGWQVWRARV